MSDLTRATTHANYPTMEPRLFKPRIRREVQVILLGIAVAVTLLLAWSRESSAGQACLFSEGTDWQLACTGNMCVICQDGECKKFAPGGCRGLE